MVRFAAVLLLILSSAARAADAAPPRIDHDPVTSATRGQALVLRARITSPSGLPIVEPAAFLKLPGIPAFSRLPLAPLPPLSDVYAVEVPAALVTGDFDYYLEAFDAQHNPARLGSPEAPLRVTVQGPAAVASDAPRAATLVVQTPSPRSQGTTVTLAVIGGVAGGAGAGFGWASRTIRREFEGAAASHARFDVDNYADGQRFAIIADVGFAASALFLSLALTHALWPEDAPEPARP